MSNVYTTYAIFLGPLVLVLVFVFAAAIERRRAGAAAEPNFFARNGAPVATFLILAVGIWALKTKVPRPGTFWPVVGSVAVLITGKVFDAVFINRAFTVSGVRPGCFWSIRATAPETTGVAMLVPLIWK